MCDELISCVLAQSPADNSARVFVIERRERCRLSSESSGPLARLQRGGGGGGGGGGGDSRRHRQGARCNLSPM